ATGADNGDTLANGEELVNNQWIQGKSITNSDASYTLLGNGATLTLGDIAANSFHSIQLLEVVPANATPVPPDGNITFELEVTYDLMAS
ncbi:MAG: hypothetical protein K8E24_011970, partial [Methanobacterium paludis]|nr:hypothetical protein [Methanobacterium paludis]